MSTRPLFGPTTVIGTGSTVPGDMSASITSVPSVIQQISMFSYEVVWSGTTPVGTISVQVSNDYRPATGGNPGVAGNWSTVTLSAVPAISGNTGTGFIDIDQLGAYAVRLVYTRGSGTGTMTAVIAGKVS